MEDERYEPDWDMQMKDQIIEFEDTGYFKGTYLGDVWRD